MQQKQGFCDSCVMLLVKAGEYGLPWDGRHGYGWIRGFFRREEEEGWLWVVLIENGDVNIKVCCNCVHDRRARPFGRACGVFVQRCGVHPSVLVDVFGARAVREYGAELFVFPPEAWWVKRVAWVSERGCSRQLHRGGGVHRAAGRASDFVVSGGP